MITTPNIPHTACGSSGPDFRILEISTGFPNNGTLVDLAGEHMDTTT